MIHGRDTRKKKKDQTQGSQEGQDGKHRGGATLGKGEVIFSSDRNEGGETIMDGHCESYSESCQMDLQTNQVREHHFKLKMILISLGHS